MTVESLNLVPLNNVKERCNEDKIRKYRLKMLTRLIKVGNRGLAIVCAKAK